MGYLNSNMEDRPFTHLGKIKIQSNYEWEMEELFQIVKYTKLHFSARFG
jgi:hypothetical protein